MSEKEIGNIMGEQESYMSKEVILLLLFGLLLIIIYSCVIYMKNSKKCKKGCKCSRCKSCTKESYRTLTPSNDVFVLQTTDSGDLSKINITPIIKNWIDDKSVNNSASFSIKELTTVGNVKGSQLCIGATCLTENDLKNLKMITTSSLNSNDISLLKRLPTGVNMNLSNNRLGWTETDYIGYPSYNKGSSTYAKDTSTDNIFRIY
jgi:hypothetical protein